MPPPIVLVRWFDAHGAAVGWVKVEDIEAEDRVVESVGFLLKGVHKGHLVLAQNVDDKGGTVADLIHIPKVNVIEKRFL